MFSPFWPGAVRLTLATWSEVHVQHEHVRMELELVGAACERVSHGAGMASNKHARKVYCDRGSMYTNTHGLRNAIRQVCMLRATVARSSPMCNIVCRRKRLDATRTNITALMMSSGSPDSRSESSMLDNVKHNAQAPPPPPSPCLHAKLASAASQRRSMCQGMGAVFVFSKRKAQGARRRPSWGAHRQRRQASDDDLGPAWSTARCKNERRMTVLLQVLQQKKLSIRGNIHPLCDQQILRLLLLHKPAFGRHLWEMAPNQIRALCAATSVADRIVGRRA